MTGKQEIVVSGMRPTGRLHLGHYWGVLKNWTALSEAHSCYFFVADWHMLTTGYEDTSKLKENSREMVLDWLAAGLDPKKCVIFKQSDVPEHAELALILGMVTPLPLLLNNPSYKETLKELFKDRVSKIANDPKEMKKGGFLSADEIEESVDKNVRTQGLLGYPLLQAADIAMYHGAKVPVGQDQLPHLELSREIVRRFNKRFTKVLIEPQPLLTPTPKVPGLDGRKMSKSYDNAINLDETQESLKKKVMAAYTDPTKIRADSPGHPEPCPENPPGCTVFALHKLYADGEFVRRRGEECRAGKIGCVACKKDSLAEMEPEFSRFRAARETFAAQEGLVEGILAEGAKKARAVARETMAEVRRAMRIA
ncbi:MAG: tryptophan--tRNA ligase [Elusimicrobia bacterium]|nr:tryptophan--tRNA ligase [Elusimicrobiota bacterium]MDE2314336.1 tryptophan--tRNA ligase [Elusimicrobiota bacterium]